jgi:hypothetical protein
MIQNDQADLHAKQLPSLPLPPHGLYSRAAAALHEGLGTGTNSAASEVASQCALNRYGRIDDGEYMAQAATCCMAPPMALRKKSLAANSNWQGDSASRCPPAGAWRARRGCAGRTCSELCGGKSDDATCAASRLHARAL